MISRVMIMSSSLQKAARILVLNGVAGILPGTPFLLGERHLPTFTTHYFRSLRIPCLLYIDDRHTGEIQLSPSAAGYPSLLSDLDKSLARANSAIFLVCFTLINLGYFLGIKKSILIPRQIVPFLGFLADSVRQSFLLIEEKKQKFLSPLRPVLDSYATDVKTLQRLSGKCISFSLAIPGTRLFLNEVYNVIGKGLR